MELTFDGNKTFFEKIRQKSGQPIELCFQCQKCAAGCTMAADAEHTPNQILRMIQLGLKEKALNSNSIWLCTGCETCGARCPNGIDIAELMDALKETAIESNIIKEININLFNTVFLDTVKSMGRIHEAIMMANYKMKSGDLFSDLDFGLSMFLKGKMPLFTKGVQAKDKVKDIFEKCQSGEWQ